MAQPLEMSDKLKRIVVAGATGAVGRHCVHILIRDPRVGSVVALTRSNPKSAEYYGLDEKTDELTKLEHLKVDYNGNMDEQLKGYRFDAGLSCIGVYTADIKDEADFFKKEYEPNIKIAKAAALHGVKRWSYLSGAGVKQTDKKSWYQPLFSWVKGSIEKDLQKVDGFEFVNSCRPGFIAGRPEQQSGISGFTENVLNYFSPSILQTKYGVHRDDISTAMVYTILSDLKQPFLCYENDDIKEAAKTYRELQPNL